MRLIYRVNKERRALCASYTRVNREGYHQGGINPGIREVYHQGDITRVNKEVYHQGGIPGVNKEVYHQGGIPRVYKVYIRVYMPGYSRVYLRVVITRV